jgi:hypothetical protein
VNTRKRLTPNQYANRVFPVLCPRCGLDICYFVAGETSPYCAGCGWNLGRVSKPRLTNPVGFLAIRSLPVLLTIVGLLGSATRRSVLLIFGTSSVLAILGELAARKNLKRMTGIVRAVSQKPGADLSSAIPATRPARVVAYEAQLRRHRRDLRPIAKCWIAIWSVHVIFAALLFIPARPLFSAAYRLQDFPGPALYVLECAVIGGLWYFFWNMFRLRRPQRVQLSGEISLARVVPEKTTRGTANYEFQAVSGKLWQVTRSSNVGVLYCGTYIPVFYDRDDPTNCFGACDLSYQQVPTPTLPDATPESGT